MFKFILLLIANLCISAIANSGTPNYSFQFVEFDLIHNKKEQIANPHEVLTQYQWLQLKDVPNRYKKLFQVPKNLDGESVVLLVKTNFTINKPVTAFNKSFYRNINVLAELSGMEYVKTNQQDNYELYFSPTFFKHITAKANISFPSTLNNGKDVSKFDPISFIVHLKSYNFSSDLHQSDIISIFTKKGKKTQINNISFAITTDKSINNVYMGIKKNIMIDKLNKQSKTMLDIFARR